MAHIRFEHLGDKYRLSLSGDTWVCSEGPYQDLFVDFLNLDVPISRYLTPVNPDPENLAVRDAVEWLKSSSIAILSVIYDTPDPGAYDLTKNPVEY
jgi:hypothetical protein